MYSFFVLFVMSQVCSIEMTMDTLNLATVTLMPKHLQMKERLDLTLFLITHWTLVARDPSDPGKGVRMVIILKRKITNELMTTFLPSFLLTIITFATPFFKPIYFEAGRFFYAFSSEFSFPQLSA